jgi:hypothetical protein
MLVQLDPVYGGVVLGNGTPSSGLIWRWGSPHTAISLEDKRRLESAYMKYLMKGPGFSVVPSIIVE